VALKYLIIDNLYKESFTYFEIVRFFLLYSWIGEPFDIIDLFSFPLFIFSLFILSDFIRRKFGFSSKAKWIAFIVFWFELSRIIWRGIHNSSWHIPLS